MCWLYIYTQCHIHIYNYIIYKNNKTKHKVLKMYNEVYKYIVCIELIIIILYSEDI